MIYLTYQTLSDLSAPLRALSAAWLAGLDHPWAAGFRAGFGRHFAAAHELVARAGLSHHRPDFGIGRITIGGKEVAVTEEATLTTPFGTLLHFRKDAGVAQPRVLVVAPLRAISRPCCAERCIRCCPITMSTSPTGTTRGMWARRMAASGWTSTPTT